ncbi:MAG: hypothetical protein WCA37_09020 [Terracidiphilus sp.]
MKLTTAMIRARVIKRPAAGQSASPSVNAKMIDIAHGRNWDASVIFEDEQ